MLSQQKSGRPQARPLSRRAGAGARRLEPRRLIIVPVYNEARSVTRVLEAVRRYAAGADVLAVDDGSTDATPALLARLSGVQVLRHPLNRGYGAALRAGFALAAEQGYDHVVTIDCDEQHEPALIPEFFRRLDEGWDLVSGSRYLDGVPVEGSVPPDRLAINREFVARINRLTGYGITDAFCGFKGYRTAALRALHLGEPGYGFPMEVWIEAWRHGLRMVEVPVPRIYKPNFERRFGGGLDDPPARRRYYLDVLERALGCLRCAAERLAKAAHHAG